MTIRADRTIITDSNIFRLHYKVSVFFLLVFGSVVTLRQCFGDPIDCLVYGIDSDVMDSYCWIHSTFTIPSLIDAEVGTKVAYPGVGFDWYPGSGKLPRKYHKYYQWVALCLFVQAIMFSTPGYLWNILEGGKMEMLVSQLNTPIVNYDAKSKRKAMLVRYFRLNFHQQNSYALQFFFCEFLNFLNVIGQIYLTDVFLGYNFKNFGSRVIQFNQKIGSSHNPVDEVFPKMAKCTFYNFGASATLKRVDGLCVLPLNILNEKIYIFLWFWFVLVAGITGVGLLYRMATLSSFVRLYILRIRSSHVSTSAVDVIVKQCKIGDWFLLNQMAKNMDPLIYSEFITDLSRASLGQLQ